MRLDNCPLLHPNRWAARVKLPASMRIAKATRSSISLIRLFPFENQRLPISRFIDSKASLYTLCSFNQFKDNSMKILLIGANGTIGSAVAKELGQRHEVTAIGLSSGELQ